MKKLNFAFLLLVASCSAPEKKEMVLQGAYKRLSEILSDGKKDSVMQATQNKIYTVDHLIFAGIGSDFVNYFGFGEYSIDNGKVKERILLLSVDSVVNSTPTTYMLEITQSDKGFKQVIRDIQTASGVLTFTEEYESASLGKSSKLDGAWRGIKVQSVKNADTTIFAISQYKVYESGNFIYGHTYADSVGRNITGIGYGTFEVINDSTINETVTLSTYDKPGETFLVNVEWIDDSHYRQTVSHGDVTFVEEYERIVKKD